MSDPVVLPTGPCEPWAALADLPEGCPCRSVTSGDETPSDLLLAELLAEATDVLWAMLARPAIGICEATIHPEVKDGVCGSIPRDRFRGATDGYLSSAVLLRAPVSDVIEVVVDGVAIDPSEYELHDHQWLVPVGRSWPVGGGPSAERNFEITYSFGIEVPPLVRDATIEIANYLWSQHCSNVGRTSPAIESASTQGQSYRFRRSNPGSQSSVERATNGSLLPSVQLAVSSFNPTGQSVQVVVYSPDLAYRNRQIRSFV